MRDKKKGSEFRKNADDSAFFVLANNLQLLYTKVQAYTMGGA